MPRLFPRSLPTTCPCLTPHRAAALDAQRAAIDTWTDDTETVATELAESVGADLVETRGNTAVYHR